MDEKLRLEQVFDNWYYDHSITNKKISISENINVSLMNEYLKWNSIFSVFNKYGYDDIPNYKFFDAGCGNGNALRKVIENGAEPSNCYGIDISNEVIEFAKKNSPESLNLSSGFIDETPFDSDYFDIIFNFGVLIHILDNDYIMKIADELHRIIKKNGLLFIIVSTENAIWDTDIAHTTRNFNFKLKELQNLFNKFECLEIMDLYNDSYPQQYSAGDIIKIFQQQQVNPGLIQFKLVIFRPKK